MESLSVDKICWLGHASFLIRVGDMRVYIDPFRLDEASEAADIVFITHPHFDHFSPEDIRKIATRNTAFVVPEEIKGKVSGGEVVGVRSGTAGKVKGLAFSAVPAYNANAQRLGFHPREKSWLGYVINFPGMSLYHPGDTDFIEEMGNIKVDLALLPIGGTYTMDLGEAVRATSVIQAKMYAPMHYKALLGEAGSRIAEKEFCRRVKDSIILKEKNPRYSF